MKLEGTAWKLGDSISTDLIAPGRLFHLRSNLEELAKHLLEDADPEFTKKIKTGDFIVAGKNFGLGSSREHAPRIIKLAGISAVIARSFARIFYRNAINVGLPVVECDTTEIEGGDILELDFDRGQVINKAKGVTLKIHPLPAVMKNILDAGGILPYIAKYGDLPNS